MFRQILTQEEKDQWLAALESGQYKQGTGQLRIIDNTNPLPLTYRYCCLGVLAHLLPYVEISPGGLVCKPIGEEVVDNTYSYPGLPLDGESIRKLVKVNDNRCDGKFTAVIPIIEALPVIEDLKEGEELSK